MSTARTLALAAAFVSWSATAGFTQAPVATFPYDHIHLNVPDPAAGANWYEKNFGGKRITEAPDRLMFGSTRFMFLRKADATPSAGSAIDHVGFSVPDLDAKMKELESAGVKVTTPARDVPGLFKLAFVEDPWGTRIEVVQDPELLGLHHIHMRQPESRRGLRLAARRISAARRRSSRAGSTRVKYSAEGFSDMWILVHQGRGTAEHRPRDRSHRLALDQAADRHHERAHGEGRAGHQRAAAAVAAQRTVDQLRRTSPVPPARGSSSSSGPG